MSVYVDNARIGFRRMKMSHMIADSVEELHQMAAAIGMKQEWFQPLSWPHYDVSISRRQKAIEFGAIPLKRRAFVMKLRELKGR